jgi:hypothetical protein
MVEAFKYGLKLSYFDAVMSYESWVDWVLEVELDLETGLTPVCKEKRSGVSFTQVTCTNLNQINLECLIWYDIALPRHHYQSSPWANLFRAL